MFTNNVPDMAIVVGFFCFWLLCTLGAIFFFYFRPREWNLLREAREYCPPELLYAVKEILKANPAFFVSNPVPHSLQEWSKEQLYLAIKVAKNGVFFFYSKDGHACTAHYEDDQWNPKYVEQRGKKARLKNPFR